MSPCLRGFRECIFASQPSAKNSNILDLSKRPELGDSKERQCLCSAVNFLGGRERSGFQRGGKRVGSGSKVSVIPWGAGLWGGGGSGGGTGAGGGGEEGQDPTILILPSEGLRSICGGDESITLTCKVNQLKSQIVCYSYWWES